MPDGDGAGQAGRAADLLCETVRPTALLGAGIAGALSTGLEIGDVLVSRRIRDSQGDVPAPDAGLLAQALENTGARAGTFLTVARPVVLASLKKALLQTLDDGGPAAADMESSAWARAPRPRAESRISSPGRSATGPRKTCPSPSAVASAPTAESGGRPSSSRRSRSRRRSRRSSGCAAASSRAPRSSRFSWRTSCPGAGRHDEARRAPGEDEPHVRSLDSRPPRADAAAGHARLPALPDRRHVRRRRRTGRRAGASKRCASSSGLLSDYSREDAARLASRWTAAGPSPNPGYGELIAEAPLVLEAFFALDGEAVSSVRAHVLRSAEGMAGFVERSREASSSWTTSRPSGITATPSPGSSARC